MGFKVIQERLYYKSGIFHNREEVTDKTIVDILTDNEVRTSVWAPKNPERILADIIGVNSVSLEGPVKFDNGWYERGIVDPDDESLIYLIDAERKILGAHKPTFFLFYDQDKVRDENRYEWKGTFQEILDEFEIEGYRVERIE
jgi:hypothetical protein